MRFSSIRTGIVAAAAAIALAACGGHGLVPSQSAGPTGMTPSIVEQSASPCKITGFWYFMGACSAVQITSKGGTYTLPAYQGITFTITVGANNAKGKVPVILGDATGKGDITGTYKGKKFPPYSAKTCVKGTSCLGTPVVYFEAFNTTKTEVKITGNSQLIVKAKKFPGKTCFPALLSSKGWEPFVIAAAPVKNGKVTITILGAAGAFNLYAGPGYSALACK